MNLHLRLIKYAVKSLHNLDNHKVIVHEFVLNFCKFTVPELTLQLLQIYCKFLTYLQWKK